MAREAIHAALFAKLSGISWSATSAQTSTVFKTKSRRLKHWSDVPGDMHPAMFLAHKTEHVVYGGKGLPAKRTMLFDAYVYVNTGGRPDIDGPSQMMNPIIDAIEAALQPSGPSDTQTLGGTVSHCWISGTIETDEGALGDQGVAIIPIEITVP